jgi:hypothetical protein
MSCPRSAWTATQANVHLSVGAEVLVAVFGCRKKNWSLRSVEVRRGKQATTFHPGRAGEGDGRITRPRAPGAGRCRRVIVIMAGMACGALLAAGGERA